MLNPEDLVPVGAHEGYRKNLTELYAGGRGVSTLDPDAMGRFPNLEVLWLNDNKLSKLKGLENNFRLKHLFLHNNSIATVCNASCCLTELRHLETLQLACNQLQDLKATLGVLSQLPFLKTLQLAGNPLESESSYREAVIFAIPSLQRLDSAMISSREREAAIKLFTARRIEKPMAFLTVPKIWDKPRKIEIGEPSVAELQLRREVRANTIRRSAAAEMQRVVTMREVQKPSFEVTFSKSASALLSASCGGPVLAKEPFEFVARGRVPKLLLRLGRLSLTPELANLAESYDAVGSDARVHLAVTCMGLLPRPLLSKDVNPDDVKGGGTALVRGVDGTPFEAFLFPPEIYAKAYDKVLTMLQAGKHEVLSVGISLKETSSGTPLATATLPLAPLFTAPACEQAYPFDAVALVGADGATLGSLSATVTTDWGLANTSAAEYGNSRFVFAERRRESSGAPPPSSAPLTSGPHLARDRFYITSSTSGSASAAADDVHPPSKGKIVLDTAKYSSYLKAKQALEPTVRTVTQFHL